MQTVLKIQQGTTIIDDPQHSSKLLLKISSNGIEENQINKFCEDVLGEFRKKKMVSSAVNELCYKYGNLSLVRKKSIKQIRNLIQYNVLT